MVLELVHRKLPARLMSGWVRELEVGGEMCARHEASPCYGQGGKKVSILSGSAFFTHR